jgi:hypothetical protein
MTYGNLEEQPVCGASLMFKNVVSHGLSLSSRETGTDLSPREPAGFLDKSNTGYTEYIWKKIKRF